MLKRNCVKCLVTAIAILSCVQSVGAQDYQEDYIGTVRTFAFDFCPKGYLRANGDKVSVQQYNDLYSLIGESYDDDRFDAKPEAGRWPTTFKLPDLTGKTIVGRGDKERVGLHYGSSSVTLTRDNIPVHGHDAKFFPNSSDVPVKIPENKGNMKASADLTAYAVGGTNVPKDKFFIGMGGIGMYSAPIYVDPSTIPKGKDGNPTGGAKLDGVTVSISGTPPTAAFETSVKTVTGGSVFVSPSGPTTLQPVDIRNPAMVLTVCIAYKGRFPERPDTKKIP